MPQRDSRLLGEIGRKGREHALRTLDQQDRRIGRIDVAEVAAQRVVRDLAQSARQFHTGGSAADDDEGEPRLPRRRIDLPLGRLESEQHPPANLQRIFHRLEAGCGSLPIVVAEIGIARASRHDQGVIGKLSAIGEKHAAARGIHIDHFRQVYFNVLLAPEDAAQRRGDLARRKARGCDLIEERLKQVEVAPIYQRDCHRRMLERPGGLEAAKSAADDDDPMCW